jgi:dihydroorotate dehydrogenase electron transfer subunit
MLAAPMQTRVHALRRLRDLGGGSFAVEVDGPIPATLPGQFYMLRTEKRWPVQLPRPFSLYDRAADGSWGSFLVKGVGEGTRAILDLAPGEGLVLNGPLGQPFPRDIDNPICVAGGVGLAPFLLLAREARRRAATCACCSVAAIAPRCRGSRMSSRSARVFASTDDGSHGFHGMVTALLDDLLARGEVKAGEVVFCCGPDPMMHAVAALCEKRGLRCFLSLETYMACGYGVCNGCTVKVQGPRFKGWPYSRTCMEGPVYEACELVH